METLKPIIMYIWILYLKNYIVVQHILTLIIFYIIFYLGNINLAILEFKILPLQLFILLVCYLSTHYIILTDKFKQVIEKEKINKGITK